MTRRFNIATWGNHEATIQPINIKRKTTFRTTPLITQAIEVSKRCHTGRISTSRTKKSNFSTKTHAATMAMSILMHAVKWSQNVYLWTRRSWQVGFGDVAFGNPKKVDDISFARDFLQICVFSFSIFLFSFFYFPFLYFSFFLFSENLGKTTEDSEESRNRTWVPGLWRHVCAHSAPILLIMWYFRQHPQTVKKKKKKP